MDADPIVELAGSGVPIEHAQAAGKPRRQPASIDVLTQVSAVTKALEAVVLGLLDEHLRHCVTQASATCGDVADQKITEASAAIARLVKP